MQLSIPVRGHELSKMKQNKPNCWNCSEWKPLISLNFALFLDERSFQESVEMARIPTYVWIFKGDSLRGYLLRNKMKGKPVNQHIESVYRPKIDQNLYRSFNERSQVQLVRKNLDRLKDIKSFVYTSPPPCPGKAVLMNMKWLKENRMYDTTVGWAVCTC